MRVIWLLSGCAIVLCAGGAFAQTFQIEKKKPDEFVTPRKMLGERLKRNLTEEQFNGLLWDKMEATRAQDDTMREDVMLSETTPFRMRRSVWADETMTRRSAEGGAGKFSYEAAQRPLPQDRWEATQLPEKPYPGKDEDEAILAAVYRHFFDYRARGFGRDAHIANTKLKRSDVYFLGVGPHVTDVSPTLLAGLQKDPGLVKDGIKLKPISRALEVTDDAIRDRDSGAYGPAFRVDEVRPEKNGEVQAMATFSERNGFWFTRDLTLRRGKSGWEVVDDRDHEFN